MPARTRWRSAPRFRGGPEHDPAVGSQKPASRSNRCSTAPADVRQALYGGMGTGKRKRLVTAPGMANIFSNPSVTAKTDYAGNRPHRRVQSDDGPEHSLRNYRQRQGRPSQRQPTRVLGPWPRISATAAQVKQANFTLVPDRPFPDPGAGRESPPRDSPTPNNKPKRFVHRE